MGTNRAAVALTFCLVAVAAGCGARGSLVEAEKQPRTPAASAAAVPLGTEVPGPGPAAQAAAAAAQRAEEAEEAARKASAKFAKAMDRVVEKTEQVHSSRSSAVASLNGSTSMLNTVDPYASPHGYNSAVNNYNSGSGYYRLEALGIALQEAFLRFDKDVRHIQVESADREESRRLRKANGELIEVLGEYRAGLGGGPAPDLVYNSIHSAEQEAIEAVDRAARAFAKALAKPSSGS